LLRGSPQREKGIKKRLVEPFHKKKQMEKEKKTGRGLTLSFGGGVYKRRTWTGGNRYGLGEKKFEFSC